jgi:hypothetical protein
MAKAKWKLIGNCAVDSGQLIMVDPCYVLPDTPKAPTGTDEQYTYEKLLKDRDFGNSNHLAREILFSDIAGTGVVFDTGLGDGLYPVYAKIEDLGNNDKRITEVKIKFI